ncbi:MAG TPA: hypothetical protein DCE11_06575 [Ruminiclostridium sp.]|nr:class I SAM-dependent methyltransferase [Clostridiaceae bacterium]HAA25764.1 hypothetical protein [Ruminiclostridium sp.]
MQHYLEQEFDYNNENLVSAYDELPLWSSPFGLLMLEKIRFRPSIKALDVGCGTGFPLLELSQRFGSSCRFYGIDCWAGEVKRLKKKIEAYGLKNVSVVQGNAADMPFENNYFDLVVSNLGINNFKDFDKVLNELYRVTKPGGGLAFTTNPPGTMNEFYEIFETVLLKLNLHDELNRLRSHVSQSRKSINEITGLLKKTGFDNINTCESTYSMRFLDGSSFLNHYFIKLAFMGEWKSLISPRNLELVFNNLENELNLYAGKNGELKLSIPVVYIECEKRDDFR